MGAKNLFRMYRHFVAIYVKGKMAYHGALVFELVANTILIGVYFAGFMVIFHNFDGIAGWSRDEVLFMFTTSWLPYSLSGFFFWRPMKDMGKEAASLYQQLVQVRQKLSQLESQTEQLRTLYHQAGKAERKSLQTEIVQAESELKALYATEKRLEKQTRQAEIKVIN